MRKKLFYLTITVVFISTIFVSAYLASAAPKSKGNDRVLSKVKFIHYKKGYGKPESTPGGGKGNGKDKDEGDYTYLARGAKWKVPEEYLLNPTHLDEVTDEAIGAAVGDGMDEWESHANFDIFESITIDYTATFEDLDVPQGENTISFQDFGSGNENVIAEATVWGYFGGQPSQREIIEAHIVLNDNFLWGVVTNPEAPFMDVQNIVTHELGHCAGMGDLYKTDTTEETMYGYSDEGETKKRDLYKGDIAGITNLYQ